MKAIAVHELRKSYARTEVLRGLELEVGEGCIYGLLGRNGAGKSTLLRVLIGLARADAGEARVLGQELSVGCPAEKARVAFVAQGEFLPGWARIQDLLRFDAALRPEWDGRALERWLAAEKLKPSARVGKLSAGLRKRLELELALASQPSVLLMDEPFAGLDPVSRAEILEQTMAYAATRPLTILVSSHLVADLERLCDRVGVLARGVIAFEAELDALKERMVLVTSQGAGDLPAPRCDGVIVASRAVPEGMVWIVANASEAALRELPAQGHEVSRVTLEDLAVELVRALEPR